MQLADRRLQQGVLQAHARSPYQPIRYGMRGFARKCQHSEDGEPLHQRCELGIQREMIDDVLERERLGGVGGRHEHRQGENENNRVSLRQRVTNRAMQVSEQLQPGRRHGTSPA